MIAIAKKITLKNLCFKAKDDDYFLPKSCNLKHLEMFYSNFDPPKLVRPDKNFSQQQSKTNLLPVYLKSATLDCSNSKLDSFCNLKELKYLRLHGTYNDIFYGQNIKDHLSKYVEQLH